jgi:PST family polysaccharide transporter
MEKLGMTAILNFIVELAFTVGIFAFLRDRDQYILVLLLSSGSQILAGCLAICYAIRDLVPDFRGPKISKIIDQLKQGWTVFISSVFVNFYTASNTVILGFFAARENVGYFTGGLKIVQAIQALVFYPLAQAAYPHIAKLMKEQREKGLAYIKKMTLVTAAVTIPISLGLMVLAPVIVRIILGSEFMPSVYVLRMLSLFPFVIGLSNVWGIQGVLNLNEDRAFLRTIIIGSVLNLILNFTLAGRLKEDGTSLSWLFTEIYITTAFFFVMRRSGIELFDIAFYKNWIHSGLVSREV